MRSLLLLLLLASAWSSYAQAPASRREDSLAYVAARKQLRADSANKALLRQLAHRDSLARIAYRQKTQKTDSLRAALRAEQLNTVLLTPARRRAVVARKPAAAKAAGPRVYICGGGSSYAYHSSDDCSGLNRCTHGISAVTKADAERQGRQPCQKCY